MDIVELVTTVLLALFAIAFCGVSKTGEAPFGPTIAFFEIMKGVVGWPGLFFEFCFLIYRILLFVKDWCYSDLRFSSFCYVWRAISLELANLASVFKTRDIDLFRGFSGVTIST